MLKKIACFSILLFLFSGCGKQQFPSSRLQQPTGGFSYITPEGWFRTRLAGLDYIIVSSNAAAGIKPNIFIERILPNSQLATAVERIIAHNKSSLRNFTVEEQSSFTTQSGLQGIKLRTHHKNKQDLSVAAFRYLIQDSSGIISITCTCADSVKSKYKPVFDSAMSSVESSSME